LVDRLGAYVVTNSYLNTQQLLPWWHQGVCSCNWHEVGWLWRRKLKILFGWLKTSNRQFIQEENRGVLYYDRVPVSTVARFFLLSEAFGSNLCRATRKRILIS